MAVFVLLVPFIDRRRCSKVSPSVPIPYPLPRLREHSRIARHARRLCHTDNSVSLDFFLNRVAWPGCARIAAMRRLPLAGFAKWRTTGKTPVLRHFANPSESVQ